MLSTTLMQRQRSHSRNASSDTRTLLRAGKRRNPRQTRLSNPAPICIIAARPTVELSTRARRLYENPIALMAVTPLVVAWQKRSPPPIVALVEKIGESNID